MKKLYSIPEILSGAVKIVMTILIIYFFFFNKRVWDNYYWGLICGIYDGWYITSSYYKNKLSIQGGGKCG